MGVIGWVDPRGDTPLPEVSGLPRWYTAQDLLNALASNTLGESHWTYEMAAAVMQGVQERGDMISTTAITGMCPRAEIIKRREDYVGDLNELYSALRGTLMHRTLELASPPGGAIAEVRFFTTVDGIEISGAPDMFTPTYLVDYKVPADQGKIPMQYLYTSQVEQLMLNAFIVRNAERWDPADAPLAFDPREAKIETVGIVFIGPQRPKVMVFKKSVPVTTLAGKSKNVRLPYVWTDEEVLQAVRPRLHLLKNALESYPEWPEQYEDPESGVRWRAEEIWGGVAGSWRCPGWPSCKFATCLAKREVYVW